MGKLLLALLILFTTTGCDRSSNKVRNDPPADLFERTPPPPPSGDKGQDALNYARAYVRSDAKVEGWIQWWCLENEDQCPQ